MLYSRQNKTVEVYEMKQEAREYIKEKKGITNSINGKKSCSKCLYHQQKICQIHILKTKTTETCKTFQSQRTHKVYRGGSVSPK